MSNQLVLKRPLVAIGLVVLGALVAVLIGSCGGAEEPAVYPLAGTQWQVQSYHDSQMGRLTSPLAGTQLTASWSDDQVSGTAGCNSYSAAYTVDRESLSIQPPVATKMACAEPPGIMEQEAGYLAALQLASSFTSTTAQLQVFNSDGNVVLVFVPFAPMPPATETPAEATGTPVPATETPVAIDSTWERIQVAGKIVAGTSSGYPPFEYYVGPDLDGFDIALMDEIGQRLGMPVEYKDLDAESLAQGLINGDIDVGIAHLVWTEERAEYVDFSKIYYTDRPAALALKDSAIALTALEDLAKYRVGVQNNSVYETKLRAMFDEAGLPSVDYLYGYVDADRAVQALEEGEVDLVAMHNQAAQTYVEQGKVKEVGVAKNPIYLAIALPKGASTLKVNIDDVIKALFDDGTISDLSLRYMGEEQLEPTPTPAPTTTPKPTSTPVPGECSNRLELVKDPAVGDVKPGTAFTKTWQVKNTGTCPWGKGYQLVFVGGEKMNGAPVPVAGEVKANATFEFKLNLVAPVNPGVHQGLWQMVDSKGILFGEKLKVDVNVPAGPTATPKPTQTPTTPSVRFWADDYHIKANESTMIRWQVEQVNRYWVYREDQNWQDHPKTGADGQQEVHPSVDTTWYLRVEYLNGKIETLPCTIYVEPPPPEAPEITRFTADPEQITLGECVTLRWEVDNHVDKSTLYANGEVVYRGGTDISTKHCPEQAGAVEYVLEAENADGIDTDDESVFVVQPQPQAPVISQFSAEPGQVDLGGCVTINWQIDNAVDRATLYANNEVLFRGGATGSTPHCPEKPGTVEYLLEAENADGIDDADAYVTVLDPQPQRPEITYFSVEPQNPAFGEDSLWLTGSVLIRWQIGGNVTEVRLTANDVLLADQGTDSSYTHTPEAVGAVEYKIWAKGPGGETSDAKTITVVEPELPPTEPPPTETPEVPDPKIKYFDVNPREIRVLECVNIGWRVSDGTTWVRLLRNQEEIFSDAVFEGQTQDCSRDQPGQYTYQLEASNNAGVVVLSDAFTVNVMEAAPPPEQPPTEPAPPEPPLTGTTSALIDMRALVLPRRAS